MPDQPMEDRSQPVQRPISDESRRTSRWTFYSAAVAVAIPFLVVAGMLRPGACLISLMIVTGLVFQRIRAHVAALMLIFAAAALVGTILGQPWLNLTPSDLQEDDGTSLAERWHGRGPFNEALPVVLHIVLDELMSSGAVDVTLPGGAAAHEAMLAFGRTHGFRMFDSVYSQFYFSGLSIPNLMDAEYGRRAAVDELAANIVTAMDRNRYFSDMASRGYRTAVFQSAVLDFCRPSEVRMCDTFPSYDPGMADESMFDDRTRSIYLWDTLLRAYEPSYVSAIGRWFIRTVYGIDQRELGVLGAADRFDVQGFPRSFDRFTSFVARAPRGSHIFAHFLTPHAPYLLTEACVVSGKFDSGYSLASRFDPSTHDNMRQRYYEGYFKQVQCVMSKLDALMKAIAAVPALSDALIVIHGDHGSRISAGELIEDHTPRDFIDNYGAFFAVREAGLTAGIDCEFASLSQVFNRVMRQEVEETDGDRPPVFVKSRAGDNVRIEAPMPVFGCAAQTP